MDSLRYWVTERGVDGYRFDLAPTLARQDGGVTRVDTEKPLMPQRAPPGR
jgi:glycogen operon protein